MFRRYALLGLLLLVPLSLPAFGQVYWQDDIRAMAGELVNQMSRAGIKRIEIIPIEKSNDPGVDQLFFRELTDQIVMAGGQRDLTVLNKLTWDSLDKNAVDCADRRYNCSSLPRAGETLGAQARLEVSIQKIGQVDYRLGARTSKNDNGQAMIASNRILTAPTAPRHQGLYKFCSPWSPC